MNYITSVIIFSIVLYCLSDRFVSAIFPSSKRKLIKQHIRIRYAEQKQIPGQRREEKSWNPASFLLQSSETECTNRAWSKIEKELPKIKAGEISGIGCDLKPVSSRESLFSSTVHPAQRHYTLFVGEPELTTNTWVLHVIHDGRKEKRFYDTFLRKLRMLLKDPKYLLDETKEPKVEIEFTRYGDYPFKTKEMVNTNTIGSYIIWVTCLTQELKFRHPKRNISPEDVRATLSRMKFNEMLEAFKAFRNVPLSTRMKASNEHLLSQ